MLSETIAGSVADTVAGGLLLGPVPGSKVRSGSTAPLQVRVARRLAPFLPMRAEHTSVRL